MTKKGWCFIPTSAAAKRIRLKTIRGQPAFPWHMLERQVMVIGKAERLSTLEVVKYFHSRPRDSQIGAWVSKQSSRISARGILESKFLELKQKFQQGKCRCRASGADSASALSRWSSGRGRTSSARPLFIPAR
jgi:pyridoxamine 5'-phosphate oxidase